MLLLLVLAGAPRAAAQEAVVAEPPSPRVEGVDWVEAARDRRRRAMGVAEAHLDLARALYFRAVQEEAAVGEGLAVLDTLERMWPRTTGPAGALRDAYRGAFTTLRAKHGWWPPDRLKHTRSGLTLLDRAVAQAPDDAEVRYLRLMSGFYLPGLFGRGDEVREDFAALAGLLPGAEGMYPAPIYREVVRFVLEEGDPDDEARAALEALLQAPDPAATGVPPTPAAAGGGGRDG